MKPIITLSITAEDCYVDSFHPHSTIPDVEPVPESVTYWTIWHKGNVIAEGYPSKEAALGDIDNVVNYYNSQMWNDMVLADMYIRYMHHLKRFNEQGCRQRGDFYVDEEYQSYVSGLGVQLQCAVDTHLKSKFTAMYGLAPVPNIREYVESV